MTPSLAGRYLGLVSGFFSNPMRKAPTIRDERIRCAMIVEAVNIALRVNPDRTDDPLAKALVAVMDGVPFVKFATSLGLEHSWPFSINELNPRARSSADRARSF